MLTPVPESGPATAPTIVFLHGGGGGPWMWRPQIEQLSTEYHCLAPDLREPNDAPFTIPGAAEQVAELIRKCGHGGKAHVVGLSLGAQIAVALLGLAPELLDHVVLSGALVRPLTGSALMTPTIVGQSHRWLVAPLRGVEWWIRLNMKYAAGVPKRFHPDFRRSLQELTERAFVSTIVENQRFRLPAGLDRVRAPTLIVAGKREYRALRLSAHDLAAAIPSGRAFLVAHRGRMRRAEEHNWNLTAPDLFTRTVRAWLTDQPLPVELEA